VAKSKGGTPFDDDPLPNPETPTEPTQMKPEPKPRKKAVRTPLSRVMRIANAIDRLLNRLPDHSERKRALNVVLAAQAELPFEERDPMSICTKCGRTLRNHPGCEPCH